MRKRTIEYRTNFLGYSTPSGAERSLVPGTTANGEQGIMSLFAEAPPDRSKPSSRSESLLRTLLIMNKSIQSDRKCIRNQMKDCSPPDPSKPSRSESLLIAACVECRLGIVVTLLSRQFRNKDNNCRNKMMETIKTIKILEIILPEKHN